MAVDDDVLDRSSVDWRRAGRRYSGACVVASGVGVRPGGLRLCADDTRIDRRAFGSIGLDLVVILSPGKWHSPFDMGRRVGVRTRRRTGIGLVCRRDFDRIDGHSLGSWVHDCWRLRK